uniref:Tc1-like transposase DDE domain-containing protein n=1 Tax=Myripristis murdjan TaxID=586833 RepID=A0A667XRJ5_9TELE
MGKTADLTVNLGEIHKECTAAGVSASRATTHRRIQDTGYNCCVPCDKKDWTVAHWSKVLFSDESKFCISFGNQGPRVWRKRGEAQNPSCLTSSVKFPQSKVSTAVYQQVLEHFMLPSADQLYGDADFIFQQDLAPAHTAKSTNTWFKNHGVSVLDWPANSPDVNPIENLWGIVKKM